MKYNAYLPLFDLKLNVKSGTILRMKEYLEKLNKEQYEATVQTEGPVLVLAGAGSGKTRVLTSRIAYILDQGLCMPWQILAITFTNKAANEMRERVSSIVGEDVSKMWISTIHSMCLRILRASIGRLDGYNENFTVYSEAETDRILKKIIGELELDGDNVLKNAKYHISFAKTNDISPDRYLIEGKAKDASEYVSIYKRYEQILHDSNAMDFDDLILKAYRLLEEDEEVRHYYADKFHYILIDEFQDTNYLQYKIVKLLSSVHNNVFAVGDDDQSIYGWRGAEIKNILEFGKEFKSAKTFKLQQNYRSTKKILDLANAVIKKNTVRSQKTLWTDNDDGVKIEYYCADDEGLEARYAVNQILRLRERGAKYSDFAVLMRVNALSRSYEQEFMRRGIPFKVFGGFKFFERKEIKDLTAYLRLLANPLDNDALLRVINTPRRGIGDKTINELNRYASENDLSLFDALTDNDQLNLTKGAKAKLEGVKRLLFSLTMFATAKPVTEVVDEVIAETDFLSQFEEQTDENISKKMNVDEFKNSVQEYVKSNPAGTLSDYLGSIALYSDIDEADSSDYVTLATIHAVKGLEFNTVFIAGCDETIFPISRAVGSPEDMEEERRLMYVAITRAEKRLYITRASSRYLYGERKFTVRSRFVSDVADKLGIDKTSERPFKLESDGYEVRQKQSFSDRKSYYNSSDFDYGYSADEPSSHTGVTSNYAKSFVRNKPQPMMKNNPSNKTAQSEYRIGRLVRHKKFGVGKIISVQNSGINTMAEIDFVNAGRKTLAVNFAPLELL